jgi:hypothetical protein
MAGKMSTQYPPWRRESRSDEVNSPATFTDLFIMYVLLFATVLCSHCDIEHSLDGLQVTLESRCPSIEQAGSRESGWESSQPLGGGELIHYE